MNLDSIEVIPPKDWDRQSVDLFFQGGEVFNAEFEKSHNFQEILTASH